jgi:anaerobic selenocysteine-containing dehydrogenase
MTDMDRRRFLKVTAITGASAALAQCGSPENQIIRFVPDDELVPGVAEWKPSVCPLCSAGCGVIARVMDGDVEVIRGGQHGVTRMGLVKKLEGNPQHPVSQGKLCVRGQAALQVMYHPDRIASPLKRSGERGSGRFEAVSWDAALDELVSRLDTLVAGGDAASIAFLGRPRRGRRSDVVDEFLGALGAPAPVAYELFDDSVLRRANDLSFGHPQLPTFDLARARYVLGFGADFLATWNSPVAQSVAYGRMRQEQAGARGRFVQAEPRLSTTGAAADEWIAVRPGTEGVLALGIAHVIMKDGARPATAGGRAAALINEWAAGLPSYTPAQVEQRTGVRAARVERIAREFASQTPAVAIIGGAPLAHTNGLHQALAVNALNALVGSIDVPGGVGFAPQPPRRGRVTRSLRDLLAASLPKALLLDDGNPIFGAPAAWRVGDHLRQIPFIVSFGSFIDETSVLADLLLPDHTFLESWTESWPEAGTTAEHRSIAPPAVRPLHDTRATPDVLLEVARRLQKPLSLQLPKTFAELLKAPAPAAGAPAASAPATAKPAPARSVPASEPAAIVEATFDGDAAEYPFHFLPYASQAFLDGSLAHLPWLQELPDPLTSAMWSSWVEINPHTAEKLHIADGDLVEIASAHGAIRAPAVLSPGVAPDTVAMPVGQGHERFTRYATGRGANPIKILTPLTESETGALAWAATRVRIARAGDGDGSLILFAGATRERPEDLHGR